MCIHAGAKPPTGAVEGSDVTDGGSAEKKPHIDHEEKPPQIDLTEREKSPQIKQEETAVYEPESTCDDGMIST